MHCEGPACVGPSGERSADSSEPAVLLGGPVNRADWPALSLCANADLIGSALGIIAARSGLQRN